MSEKSGLQNFLSSFSDLARLPRALWFVIGAFVIDTAAYYGVLTLMTVFLHSDLGWSDQRAGVTVSVFTMLVTLFMLGVGSYAERFGLRRAILFALLLTLGGRALYTLSPNLGSGVSVALIVLAALVITAMGCSIIQPVCYSGVKQYTDENTNSMGYGLIYALMNLGLVGMGALSSWIRPSVQDIKDAKPLHHAGSFIVEFFASLSISGVQAVNWACVMMTGFTFLLFLVLMTKKAEAAKLRPDIATDSHATPPLRSSKDSEHFSEADHFRTRASYFSSLCCCRSALCSRISG